MATEEQVLVVERTVFDRVGAFQGLTFDVAKYMEALLAPGVPRFMARPAAEVDPSFKQLIPYVLMTCAGKYLSYVRGKRAGEKRLVGQRSMGIGGHINPMDDAPLFGLNMREIYDRAVTREVDEEVHVETRHRDHIVALLNDDSTDVGKVHLGIVHGWVLDEPKVSKRESMITQPEFLSRGELIAVRSELETWSAFCVDHLEEIEQRVMATVPSRRPSG